MNGDAAASFGMIKVSDFSDRILTSTEPLRVLHRGERESVALNAV